MAAASSSSETDGNPKVLRRNLLKVVVIGDSGVGKTSILTQYVEGRFIEEHQSTIGADLLTKRLRVDDTEITLQIWDTAGQERFQSLGAAFYRGSDACIFVYDITSRQSFQNVNNWKNKFVSQASDPMANEFTFVLLGNKSDKSDSREVNTEDGQAYARENHMMFYETCAVNGKGLEDAFYNMTAKASAIADDDVAFYGDETADEIKQVEVKLDQQAQEAAGGCMC